VFVLSVFSRGFRGHTVRHHPVEKARVKLRTLVSLFLFLFGLAPLLAVVIINVPLVFDKLELFYHKAYLQNLRADFRDLDQHIARRHEMVLLLAKLPEPGMLLDPAHSETDKTLKEARGSYTDWVNRVLFDQLDITEIVFLDQAGRSHFSLERDPKTGVLTPGKQPPALPSADFLAVGLQMPPGRVLTGPISINWEAGKSDPKRFMTLRFISPIVVSAPDSVSDGVPETRGAVLVNMDVGGLAGAYPGIYWVHDNGHYLTYGNADADQPTAFEEFPGLEDIFAKGELNLWKYGEQQVFWVPLFPTEDAGPLWVGRRVDASPIAEFRSTLEMRTISIVAGLLIVVFIFARLIAIRIEKFGHELTDGITRVLEHSEVVEFSWARPEELRTLGDNLTRLAQTHAQASAALRSHARELEESNRYKSEFLANVSHELRTPLNSILLLSKMLADGTTAQLGADQAQQARVIHDAGADLRALIDNILDLSRIEAGKIALKLEKVNLPALLDDVVQLMRPQFDAKALGLALEIDAQAPVSLVTDGEKLRQILVNFLSNAVKFTAHGDVRLRLSSSRGADAEQCPVRISVEDSGIGIPREKQDVIFEAFKQADGSTSRRYGGTGLGLTISRQLAHLMGGRIEIQSEVGVGSTFSLLLPLEFDQRRVDADQINVAGQQRPAATEAHVPQAKYPGCRVLVVDDDVRNLLALTPLLEAWGIEVTAAGDGQEALETLEADPRFDLVLMDLMMPELDGYDTIRRMRSRPDLRGLPVVALTAKTAAEDMHQCLEVGANEFLAKPIEPADLKRIFDRYLADDCALDSGPAGEGIRS
jgi:signal transduction histidine kinase/CheY-like chemotaxis protein